MSNQANDRVAGHLEVGSDGGGQVVVNLDYDRTGHIIFSPRQARALAVTLMRKAAQAECEVGAAVANLAPAPMGACVACAHILPMAAWDARFPGCGICAECLRLAAPNRGGCSHIRGCDCTQDGVSWRIRDAERAGEEPAR